VNNAAVGDTHSIDHSQSTLSDNQSLDNQSVGDPSTAEEMSITENQSDNQTVAG